MNAIVFGATGMVGIETLSQCLKEESIVSVTSISRKTTGLHHSKLKEIIHTEYTDYSSLDAEICNADVCYFCIGVYQNKVPKQRFWVITVDYLRALVSKFEEINPNIVFCLFSAQGADPSERSPILFAKAKGRAERILFESRLSKVYAFRAGFINPVQKEAFSGVLLSFYQFIYRIFPFIGIGADELGRVMVDVGINGNQLRIFENRDLRLHAHQLANQ